MSRSDQRGLTLLELLISLSLLLIAVAVALALYDAIWDSFKKGENAAEQQQGVRIAVSKIGADLQMAGFNHNPDGDTSRPDEQIESAYDTAIVIRADFDAGDVALSTTPEAVLVGGSFETVSTGNDEIVIYALAKPDASSPDTLTFEADVKDEPRDGGVETVQVPKVALVHDDPPYTLYRMTLSNDTSDWGVDDFIVREELAENIGSMRFRYFGATGNQLNAAFDLTTTADDIGGAEGNAVERSKIRRIEFELTGVTLDPQPGWVDQSDPDPNTKQFHKFALTSDVRPRNLGLVGTPD
jgi:prepilin-type N-terminal cleavage/methylation domain-containing protein